MSTDELLSFSNNDNFDAAKPKNSKLESWNLLVVDDDDAIHEITQLVLRKVTVLDRDIVIHSAYSAKQAKELMLTDTVFAFALIDVVMETDKAGLSLIKWIREERKDTNIRLVLRTGQPGEAPEQDLISQYDIHDYKDKNELTAKKLFTLCYSCLRTYTDIVEAKKMRKMLLHNEKMDTIGKLASGIVHDFNNILGIILGNVELLQLTSLDEKHERKINSINKAALMGKDIVCKLHAFTTNKLKQKETVNINNTIMEMDTIISQAISSSFQLNYQLGNNIWQTYIVVSDFESTLFNLIINANDAILHDGKILIKTNNCVLDNDFCLLNSGAIAGEYILLSVSDNGEGISTDAIHRIFEPFFTTKTSGTGLGLALAFSFVNHSSGYITLNSKIGVGTTFNIYLPRALL